MKTRILFLLISISFLTGCAGKAVDRFPDLTTDITQVKSVNIIADLMIVEDIAGDDLGINMLKHETAAADLKQELGIALSENGITANFIHAGSGVFFNGSPKDLEHFIVSRGGSVPKDGLPNLLVSENFKSEGLEFSGYELNQEWASEANITSIRNIFESGNAYSPTLADGEEKVAPLVFGDIPDGFTAGDATHLLIIKSEAGDVSAGKSIGVGLATGILSAVLSGGTYIATSTAVSQTNSSAVLVDIANKELIWSGAAIGGGSKVLGRTGKALIDSLYQEVKTKTKKEKKKAE